MKLFHIDAINGAHRQRQTGYPMSAAACRTMINKQSDASKKAGTRFELMPVDSVGPMSMGQLETATEHFIIAALWADAPEGTHPRASNQARSKARYFIIRFVSAYPELCAAVLAAEGYGSHPDAGSSAAAFGHDLYLTARGHGAGFWDREELKDDDLGERISEPLRRDFRRWYIEPQFEKGWVYL